MEWNEVLYILNKKTAPHEIEVLSKLSIIRDEIFFSDYRRYGYTEEEQKINLVNVDLNIFKIEFGLKSILSNRKLMLAYVFKKDCYPEEGVITDTIFILNKEKGWDNLIDMDILIQKRIGEPVNFDYRRLSSYDGTLEDKIRKCLKQIKHNYDTYAADIISGENWDSKARDTSFI